MSRYRDISIEEMTPAQREVHDEIVAGKRGRFGGPFQLLALVVSSRPAVALGARLQRINPGESRLSSGWANSGAIRFSPPLVLAGGWTGDCPAIST